MEVDTEEHPPVELIQSGILCGVANFDYSNLSIIFLKQGFDAECVKKAVKSVPNIEQQLQQEELNGRPILNIVVGIEPLLWKEWTPNNKPPRYLKPFENKRSLVHNIEFPATGGHLFLYSKCKDRLDLCFESAKRFVKSLGFENISKISSDNGFKYMGGKDLTGFTDGTRNPPFQNIIMDVGIIHKEDEIGEETFNVGGSYAFVSKFIHDLSKFEKLSSEDKSQIIGRDLNSANNPRLSDTFAHLGIISGSINLKSKPSNYHINKSYGVMFRQSWPFGTPEECGLLFLAFSRSLKEIDDSLSRMLGIASNATSNDVDNLFQITKPLSANYFYCPSIKQLSCL